MTQYLTLESLRASGLPLDWMTVYLGWTETPDLPDVAVLSVFDVDVKDVALGALATCSPDDEHSLFRITDDRGNLREEISLYLSGFATRSGISRNIALRKWRYVYLLEALAHTVESKIEWKVEAHFRGNPPFLHYENEYLRNLNYHFPKWKILPTPPDVAAKTKAEVEQNLDTLRAWLDHEKAELMQVPSLTVDGLPVSVPPLQ